MVTMSLVFGSFNYSNPRQIPLPINCLLNYKPCLQTLSKMPILMFYDFCRVHLLMFQRIRFLGLQKNEAMSLWLGLA